MKLRYLATLVLSTVAFAQTPTQQQPTLADLKAQFEVVSTRHDLILYLIQNLQDTEKQMARLQEQASKLPVQSSPAPEPQPAKK